MTWACDPVATAGLVDSYQFAGPLFVAALQTFFAGHCALIGDHLWPADATRSVLQDPNYDFIIVGSGSAGAVLANRLTEESDWKVLLIEAGGYPTLATEVPAIFWSNIGTPLDWYHQSQPQDEACLGYAGRGCCLAHGKVLGGSSSINGMYYVRGNKRDFDSWAEAGNEGWSYNDVLPYFMKSENFSEPMTGDMADYHGTEGYMHIEVTETVSEFETLVLSASSELGIDVLNDINGGNQMGIARSQSNTKDGIRQSTARAFLSPIKDRPNLHVITEALVTKLVFDHPIRPDAPPRVMGVVIRKNGMEFTVRADKEVIVSAGAINTPQILMLSGIGPAEHLAEFNIDVIADLPVGKNFYDHVYSPVFYTRPTTEEVLTLSSITQLLNLYVTEQEGAFSTLSPQKVISFINTVDPTLTYPDIQQHFLLYSPNQANLLDILSKIGATEEVKAKFGALNADNFVLWAAPVLAQPKSAGEILLQSTDPEVYPLIHANYLKEAEDVATFIRGLRLTMQLGETETFRNANFTMSWLELDACTGLDKTTDEFLECWVKNVMFSLQHQSCSARMGPSSDPNSVVDPTLKVHGVQGLRVVDASVMSYIPSGNTNAASIMIGEKGADLIKSEYL